MKRRVKKILSLAVACGAVIAGVIWICMKTCHPGKVEYTDNAQVKQQIVPIISRVQGYVKEIRYREFQPVTKGDTLIIIDDSDLQLQLLQAKAEYRNALAALEVTKRSVGVASANSAVSNASIGEAKVMMENAVRDYERYEKLLSQGAVTRQQYDAMKTEMEAKTARYQTLLHQSKAAASVVTETGSRIEQSEAAVELAQARVAAAELNLSYCVITAPCDGYTSRKDVQPGQLVQPGQTLLDMVDSGEIWITANYKETQIHHIMPGAKVRIKIDAIPGVKFNGEVESLSEATGASLSLLPQDNSAGNFVKVRQRIPVRIRLTAENNREDIERLRAGMNAECEVYY